MQTTVYIAQVPDVGSQLTAGMNQAYQWSTTVGIFLTAALMAISLIAWMIHR